MVDEVEVTEPVEIPKEADTAAEVQDTDPMIVAMNEAQAEIDGKGKEPEPEADKAAAAVEPEPKADDKAKPSPMIPKGRLDEVLSERDLYRGQVGYLQGVIDTQTAIIKGAKAPANDPDPGKGGAAASETADPGALIAKAEADKLAAAQKYEDGEITLVEFEKQRIELDRQIRSNDDKRINAMVEGAKKTANDAVLANNSQNKIESAAIQIQEQHPYVAEIDALPPTIRDGIWAEITTQAVRALNAKGINPADGTTASRLALIQEKAALTDKYGPQYTGKQLSNQKKDGPSETAQQRAAKLDLSTQQPPTMQGRGESGTRELTDTDLEKMSSDQIADLLKSNPHAVNKAAGFSNR